jgi:hypothetical protein
VRRVVLLMLGLVLVAGLVTAGVGRRAPARVYTVAQVRAGLARQPAAWIGQTVIVRGVAAEADFATRPRTSTGMNCQLTTLGSPLPCALPLTMPDGSTVYLTLIDNSASRQANMLPLVLAVRPVPVVSNPLITFVRRLPALARLLPAPKKIPDQVPGGVLRLYRIRLQPSGPISCATPLRFACSNGVDGVLVDAQP